MNASSNAKIISERLQNAQNKLCRAFEDETKDTFIEDVWSRENGGGGITRVIENGSTIDKAGINTSTVFGSIKPNENPAFKHMFTKQNINLDKINDVTFFATGISIVIHPKNPFIPTTHANFRYFELHHPDQTIWWFGGGADLTPYYLFDEDATHFHHELKTSCDLVDPTYYPKFKKECDEYFYLPHRNEHRGIGGIFFDYENKNWEKDFKFIREVGISFLEISKKIIKRKMKLRYKDKDKDKQLLKRGRYIEFNLLYDRGTKFGLNSGGNTEAILMSLPPKAKW